MTAIMVFSTAAAFLSFASVREASSMPKFEDVIWGSDAAAIPLETAKDSASNYVRYAGDEHEHAYDTIVANFLILSVDNERFHAAYVAFPSRSNFDKVVRTFLKRYGEPNESDSATRGFYWIGNDINVRVQYQPDTDEGILAVTTNA